MTIRLGIFSQAVTYKKEKIHLKTKCIAMLRLFSTSYLILPLSNRLFQYLSMNLMTISPEKQSQRSCYMR